MRQRNTTHTDRVEVEGKKTGTAWNETMHEWIMKISFVLYTAAFIHIAIVFNFMIGKWQQKIQGVGQLIREIFYENSGFQLRRQKYL